MAREQRAPGSRTSLHRGAWIVGAISAVALPFGCTSNGDSSTGGIAASSSSSGNVLCIPGSQVSCACIGSMEGVQVCNPSGSGYEPCQCPSSGNGGAGGNGAGSGGMGGNSGGNGGAAGMGGMTVGSGGSGGTGGSGTPLATCKLPAECMISTTIPTATQSSNGATTTQCVGGPDPMQNPPRCIFQADLSSLPAATGTANTCQPVTISGNIRVRLDNLPMKTTFLGTTVTYFFQIGGTCGMPNWAEIPVQIQGSGAVSPDGTVRYGCDPLTITQLLIDQTAVSNALLMCNAGSLGTIANLVKDSFLNSFLNQVAMFFEGADRARICLDIPSGATPMPAPCQQTPCDLGAACAGNDCNNGTCTCGTCTP